MAPLRDSLDLGPHELLELVRALGVRRGLVIVLAAVIKDQLGVLDEVLGGGVVVGLELGLHGAEVHGLLDDVVVVGDVVARHGVQEGPCRRVVLHVVQQVQELVVVGPVAGLARELVHVGRPARRADRRDRERVDLAHAVLPLLGRLVDLVALAEGADLGVHGFLLLQQHATHFEIPNAREHRTLHDGAAFVVLDITHPDLLVQGDLLGEALLFEITNGIVIGVG